jgi:hypothetical protein
LCCPACPVKPRAHRPDGHIKGKRDLVVAEVAERVEQQCIALPRAHLRQSRRQSSAKGRPVGSCFRLVLVDDPPIDSPTRVRPQLTTLGAESATKQVRRDPVEPREGAVACTATRSPLEGGGERLRSEFIGEVPSSPSMEVLVDSIEVPLEDQLERFRLAQGACEAVHVRHNRLHHPDCARRPTIGFKLPHFVRDFRPAVETMEVRGLVAKKSSARMRSRSLRAIPFLVLGEVDWGPFGECQVADRRRP